MISCSTPKEVAPEKTEPKKQKESVYPAWYSSTSEFIRTDSTVTAYGLAVGIDAEEALQKAEMKAKNNFEKHLSSWLESIRKNAVEETGNEGISTSSFIFALRNAEVSISDKLTVIDKETKPAKGFDSYNGFVAVAIDRDDLINNLGKQMDSNKKAWEALKASQAFE